MKQPILLFIFYYNHEILVPVKEFTIYVLTANQRKACTFIALFCLFTYGTLESTFVLVGRHGWTEGAIYRST